MTAFVTNPVGTKAWVQLQEHAHELRELHLRDLLQQPERFAECSLQLDGMLADFSRCRITADTRKLLLDLALEAGVRDAISALFAGDCVNPSEGRAALHVSLRAQSASGPVLAGVDIAAVVANERERFLRFADAVRNGTRIGSTGEPFRTVINIGIGGSDLGPRFVTAALSDMSRGPAVHFVAGLDGIELQRALGDADPRSTLFVVCSKTFGTQETMSNARAARAWLQAALGETGLDHHFAAVSANDTAMSEFGIASDARFAMWDWVGGRYSLWSAVGLSAAIAIGSEAFREMLAGAAELDAHVRNASPETNLPLQLALMCIWHQNFLGVNQHVVLPYDQRLAALPEYLQQLWMESLGKSVNRDGKALGIPTGSALWGASGSHAQHSFAQWLHQGSAEALTVYIGVARPASGGNSEARRATLANLLAQADSLAYGRQASEIADDSLAAQKVHPGNRPAIVFLLRELNPRALGRLLVLYEHSVYIQAVIWGINPFDQWGVEFGKLVARRYDQALQDRSADVLPGAGRQALEWIT